MSGREWQFSTEKEYRGKNPTTGSAISYYLRNPAREVTLEISDITGEQTFTQVFEGDDLAAGLHSYFWRLSFGGGAQSGQRGGQAITDQMRQQLITQAQAAITAEQNAQRKQQLQTALQAFQRATGTDQQRAAMQLVQLIGGDVARAFAGGAFAGGQRAGSARGGRGGRSAGPGQYLVKLTVDGQVLTQTLVIEADNPGYLGK